MDALWTELGFIRWPLLFSAVIIVALTLVGAVRLLESGARATHATKTWVDAILFWGGFAVVAGVMGTVIGIIVAAQSIEAAGAVSSTLVWGGVKIAMLSTAIGLLICILAGLSWFGLQLRWGLLRARELDGSS